MNGTHASVSRMNRRYAAARPRGSHNSRTAGSCGDRRPDPLKDTPHNPCFPSPSTSPLSLSSWLRRATRVALPDWTTTRSSRPSVAIRPPSSEMMIDSVVSWATTSPWIALPYESCGSGRPGIASRRRRSSRSGPRARGRWRPSPSRPCRWRPLHQGILAGDHRVLVGRAKGLAHPVECGGEAGAVPL